MKKVPIIKMFIFVMLGFVLTTCKKSDNSGTATNPNDPGQVAKSNLIAYFPFDGNGKDSITGLTPSTVTSAVKFVPGQKKSCYQGDSLAFMLYNLPSTSKLTMMHGFTISMWLYSPQTPTTFTPVGCFFQLNGTGDPVWGNLSFDEERSNSDSLNLHWQFFDSLAVWNHQHIVYSNPNFPASTWFYLTVAYDSATSDFNIYVKGQKIVYPGTTSPNPRYNNDPKSGGTLLGGLNFHNVTQACIGTWWDLAAGGATVGAANPWMSYVKGKMDELRIYNRALTDAEALTLYQDEVATLSAK